MRNGCVLNRIGARQTGMVSRMISGDVDRKGFIYQEMNQKVYSRPMRRGS
jgi:hypothetical protein